MRLSVVMACRNAGGTIADAVRSFLDQDHPDKELIVVDGASSDDTLDVLARFERPEVRVVSEPDTGIYHAMNKGFDRYTGDAVGFLNADDRFVDRTVLGDLAAALAEHNVVHGNVRFVTNDGGKIVRHWRSSPYPEGGFRRGWMPAHPTFYVRRAAADAVGRFDLEFGVASDYDFMLRTLDVHRFPSTFLDRVLVEMRMGGRSTASLQAMVQHNLDALRARRKWLGAGPVDAALIAKPLRKVTQILPRRSREAARAQ